MTEARRNLEDYTKAARDIELTEAAINLLERVSGPVPQRCIARLKAEQQKHLVRLDAAAARLGAPYPGKQVRPNA